MLFTKAEFAEVLRQGAATILQPALGRAGGLWEMKKVAAIAEAYNAQMAPHLYAGPVEWAANLQLAASIPNLLIAETIETPFHDRLIKGSIKVEEGFVSLPDTPGLGIEVDEEFARAHPFTGTGLHLQMQEEPCDYVNGNAFQGGAPAGETWCGPDPLSRGRRSARAPPARSLRACGPERWTRQIWWPPQPSGSDRSRGT